MNNGGKTLVIALAAVSALALSACGKSQRRGFNSKSDGVIVQTKKNNGQTLEEIQSLFPNNKVEVVSAEENIYKIKYAELGDVKNKLPDVYAEDDLVRNVLNPGFDITKSDSLESIRSIQDVITRMGCVKSLNAPEASIDLVSQNDFVGPNTVQLGTADIVLSASKSAPATEAADASSNFLANPLDGTPWGADASAANKLTLQWVLEGPKGTSTKTESTSEEFRVVPDKMGGYLVVLIAQDPATRACNLTGVMLGVTDNKDYNGPTGTPGKYSAETFFHVPQVKADRAWSVTKGDGVTIAVVDSGINYNHADLSRNIFINENEVAGNGQDDDGNGFIDDLNGWDFAFSDKYAYDDESHGTHVSGLAASRSFGIAPNAKVLPVKVILPSGSATSSSLVSGIYYAIKMKVDVINLSLGGEGSTSRLLLAALKKAQEQGIIVVVAAGNDTLNTDIVPSHFTSKDGTNVLAVAAVDKNNLLTDYSNYGVDTIDLAAPGGTRMAPLMSVSAFPEEGRYIGLPGTSMASPVVAGAAALVKSVNPNLSAEEIKEILTSSGTEGFGLSSKVTSGKILNVENAVRSARGIAHIGLAAN